MSCPGRKRLAVACSHTHVMEPSKDLVVINTVETSLMGVTAFQSRELTFIG
jgi:hypothetical protein